MRAFHRAWGSIGTVIDGVPGGEYSPRERTSEDSWQLETACDAAQHVPVRPRRGPTPAHAASPSPDFRLVRTAKMLAWASSIGAYNSRDSRVTHVITSGGGYLSISDDRHGEIQEQYAAEQHMDRSVTLTELPSDGVFPMFFNIVHVHEEGLTKDGMLEICAIVANVLGRYYPDAEPTLFESVASPSSSEGVSQEGSTWVRRSFGLSFYKLFVTKEDALQLRYTIVGELRGHLGNLGPPDFTWSDAIAREPYTTGMEMCRRERSVSCTMCLYKEHVSGAEQGALREVEIKFVSTRKKIRHMGPQFDYSSLTNVHAIELKSQELSELFLELMWLRGGKTCTRCMGKGTYVEKNDSSLPVIALDGKGLQCTAATELLTRMDVIRRTTIRAPATQETTPGFTRPNSFPICPPADTADDLRRSGDLKKVWGMTPSLLSEANSSDLSRDDLNGLRVIRKNLEVSDPGVFRVIQKFIREQMGVVGDERRYANLWVTNVYASMPGKKHETAGKKTIDGIREANNSEITGPTKNYKMDKLWIRVTGDGSSFCGNRGYHTSNSIFFEMSPKKCWQRCFCSDDIVGSSSKTCSEYSTENRGGQRLSIGILNLFKSNSGSSQQDPVVPAMHAEKRQKKVSKKVKESTKFWGQWA